MAHKLLSECSTAGKAGTSYFVVVMLNTQIQVLKQSELFGQQFNVYGTPQEPLFKAKDITNMLSLTNPREVITRVDEDERCKLNLPRQGETWFVTENGLYEILFQSRKPIARKFKKGVKTILKEIRTNGGYMVTTIDDTPETIMARALLLAQETISRQKDRADIAEKKAILLQSQNEAQSEMLEAVRAEKKRMLPKVTFATAVETSETSVLVGDLARIIKQNGVEIGQNRLFEWLRKNNFLISRAGESYNLPTQKALNMGLFEIKKTVITKPNGDSLITTTPKVTGKGQIYFVNRFLYDSINQLEIEKQKKGGSK